jgi:hypothetical protein
LSFPFDGGAEDVVEVVVLRFPVEACPESGGIGDRFGGITRAAVDFTCLELSGRDAAGGFDDFEN